MTQLNKKHTFWSLISTRRIVVPKVQRDYAYGRSTEKANQVRDELLSSFYDVLLSDEFNTPPVVLDFIYGSITKEGSITPLDGQQRLTTLFLLHLYAAIKEGREKEREQLVAFSYETRHSANEFCKSLVYDFEFELSSEKSLKEQIIDQPRYIPSYDDDPTIQSMLVVLSDIHKRFLEVDNLWSKLVNEERIYYYYLDLERFGLSDDLYIKMNSRGKPLTKYELFKSNFEKFLELHHPSYKELIAEKLDGEWANMLWDEDIDIDNGFLNLIHNILVILHYKDTSIYLTEQNIANLVSDLLLQESNLIYFISCIDIFSQLRANSKCKIEDYYNDYFYVSDEAQGEIDRIRFFWPSRTNIFKRAAQQTLTWAETIVFYGIITALQNQIDNIFLIRRYRQLRNLIVNSPFELRPEKIHSLLFDTKELIINGILPKDSFSQSQIKEEIIKNSLPEDIYNSLLVYENHEILRGSLMLFATDGFENALTTLKKFNHIFDNGYKDNTSNIRAAILAVGDYSQQDTDERKRFFVHKHDSWRSFFTQNQRRKEQELIVNIIRDNRFSEKTCIQIIDEYLQTNEKKDWRYYFIKYDGYVHNSYTQGYYYWKNRLEQPFDVIRLNSSYESEWNLEWNIFNHILHEHNKEATTLDPHGASPLIIVNANIYINSINQGFLIGSLSNDSSILDYLKTKHTIGEENLLSIDESDDRIVVGDNLIKDILDRFDKTNI